jgi:hypothetical protein
MGQTLLAVRLYGCSISTASRSSGALNRGFSDEQVSYRPCRNLFRRDDHPNYDDLVHLMRPIPSDRVNASAFPELMKRLGILYEPETETEKRALAYAEAGRPHDLVEAEYWRRKKKE